MAIRRKSRRKFLIAAGSIASFPGLVVAGTLTATPPIRPKPSPKLPAVGRAPRSDAGSPQVPEPPAPPPSSTPTPPSPEAPPVPTALEPGTFRRLGSETLSDFLTRYRGSLPGGAAAANLRLRPPGGIIAYCGATIWNNKYSLGIGGGHGDSFDDGHYAQNLTTGKWEAVLPPTSVAGETAVPDDFGEWVPGRPASQHSYNHLVTVGSAIVQAYGYAIGRAARTSSQAHRFQGGAWARYGNGGQMRYVPYTALYDSRRNRILRFPHEAGRLVEWIQADFSNAEWKSVTTAPWPRIGIYCSIGYHPVVDRFLLIDQVALPNQVWSMDPNNLVAGWIPEALVGTAPSMPNPGLEFCPATNSLVAANRQEPDVLHHLAPEADHWRWTREVFSSAEGVPAGKWELSPGNPIAPFGRVKWSDALAALVMVKNAYAPTEIFRPKGSANVAPTPPPPSTGVSGHGPVLEDNASGVARDWFHRGLLIPWRGSFEGATLGSISSTTATTIRIPLSRIADSYVLVNTGPWVNLSSRESSTFPYMQVTYADNSGATLPCLADATIAPSTAAPIGPNPRLQPGRVVLRFAAPTKPVTSAAIVLSVISAGGAVSLSVNEFVSPIVPMPAIQHGLRRRGLTGPTLIHAADFSDPEWWRHWWRTKPDPRDVQIVTRTVEEGQDLGRGAQLFWAKADGTITYGTPTGKYIFPNELSEVHFGYRLRFGTSWRGGPTQGGKLPGIAGDTSIAGNGGAPVNGTNGWSLRGHFLDPISPDSAYSSQAGYVAIGTYAYHADMKQLFGDTWGWTGRDMLGLCRIGQDYWIDQYVKVNTPGVRDGVLRTWIDGRLAFEKTDLYLRARPPYQVPGNLAIQKVWLSWLHGGLGFPAHDIYTYASDYAIATEYIGPA